MSLGVWWKACLGSFDDAEETRSEDDTTSILFCGDMGTGGMDKVSYDFVEFNDEGQIAMESHQELWDQHMSRLFLLNVQSLSNSLLSRASIRESQQQQHLPQQNSKMQRIPQDENWDCGVACLQMILQWIRREKLCLPDLHQERQYLLNKLGTQSIWTADLVCLLDQIVSHTAPAHHHRASYLLCSTSLQVEQDYQDFEYYQDTFATDTQRIAHLFQYTIPARRIPVLQVNYLPLSSLKKLVEQPNTVAMVLVDNTVLLRQGQHASPSTNPSSAISQAKSAHSTASDQASATYAGHYLVVTGTEQAQPTIVQSAYGFEPHNPLDAMYCFTVCNPGQHAHTNDQGVMHIAPTLLERAWRAQGTDEDVIFVVRHRD